MGRLGTLWRLTVVSSILTLPAYGDKQERKMLALQQARIHQLEQRFESGPYRPRFTGQAGIRNLTGSGFYQRVGNVVHVSGLIKYSNTNKNFKFAMSLPVPSRLASVRPDAFGTLSGKSFGTHGMIRAKSARGSAANQLVEIEAFSDRVMGGSSVQESVFHYTYVVY